MIDIDRSIELECPTFELGLRYVLICLKAKYEVNPIIYTLVIVGE